MIQSKPKKIAIVYSGAKHSGGIETYLQLLFENIDPEKFDLTLISLGQWDILEKLKANGARLYILPSTRISPCNVYKIVKYLKKNQTDLVVSQGTVANAYARAASFFSRVLNLVVVHSDLFYDYSNFLMRFLYTTIDRISRFQTKHYIAVSSYLKGKLLESGIASGKVTVIYNGVPLSRHSSEGLRLYQSLDSEEWNPGGIITIGSIGRLHQVKNYTELILALPKLKNTDYQLKIYGEGNERSKLEALISELKLKDKVELLGNVQGAREQLNQIDIYVQPSLSEGFGITVVEAMLAAKPVIVTPCGSLPELIKDGETGIVTKGIRAEDIAEAINELVSDREKATTLAKAGLEYARDKFSIERWIKETEKAFEEVIE